jgi:hypothetical protein
MRRHPIALLTAFACLTVCAKAAPTYRVFSGECDALAAFINELGSLGLSSSLVDFETMPDGSPSRTVTLGNPVTYSINLPISVTFSTSALQLDLEGLVNSPMTVSGQYHMHPGPLGIEGNNAQQPISATFHCNVAAAGLWLTDIDNWSHTDAWVGWTFHDGTRRIADFDASRLAESHFFGLITYSDSTRSAAANSIVRIDFDQTADNATCVDDVYFAVIPAPSALVLGSIGIGFVNWLCRRRIL